MIQIIGVREEHGKLVETFTDKHWCLPSVHELFTKNKDLIDVVPRDERYDLFFTVHDVEPGRERSFVRASSILFEVQSLSDFDGSLNQAMQVAAVLSELTDTTPDVFSVATTSPTSLLFDLPLRTPIRDKITMKEEQAAYKDLCFDFEFALRQEGFGHARVNKKAWKLGGLMRVPGTGITREGEVWSRSTEPRLSVVEVAPSQTSA